MLAAVNAADKANIILLYLVAWLYTYWTKWVKTIFHFLNAVSLICPLYRVWAYRVDLVKIPHLSKMIVALNIVWPNEGTRAPQIQQDLPLSVDVLNLKLIIYSAIDPVQ